jgi:membrane protease YdiL (CAAX protease family)
VSAVIVSVPISIIIALLLGRAHEAGPFAGLDLSPWLIVLYFAVGAPVQEEVIFRGLLQTTLANRVTRPPSSGVASGVAASLLVALLFGAIHIVVGPYTA